MTHTPFTTCPVCYATVTIGENSCSECGLLFASYTGAASVAPVPLAPPKPFESGWPLAGGRYIVRRRLKSGGMGNLFLASDTQAFGRLVVIKALRDYFNAADPQISQAAQARFAAEASTLAALKHPAIPFIYSYFQDGSHACIVMEHIEGQDLDHGLSHIDETTGQTITGKAYPREDVVRWGIALCRVLEYLHSRQPQPVIHHDIKPANLLLDRGTTTIRLIDFGTATQGTGALPDSYGTPGYAPPEQYRNSSEPRSDVYALAATLYHLATDDDPGLHPFSFPEITQLGSFGKVLRRALESDIVTRPSASELRAQLEGLAQSSVTRSIQTPDGLHVFTPSDLVHWCEANWNAAALWLYNGLPDQIERWWGRSHAELAHHLRTITAKNTDHNAALDAALVRLDPTGYGAESPLIAINEPAVNFAFVSPRHHATKELAFYNLSRRYIDVTIAPPPWVTVSTTQVSLLPKQEQKVQLHAQPGNANVRGFVYGTLPVRSGTKTLDVIYLQAAVYPFGSFFSYGLAALINAFCWVRRHTVLQLVMVVLLMSLSPYVFQHLTRALHLYAAHQAFEQGDWTTSRKHVDTLLLLEPSNQELIDLRLQSYISQATVARAKKQWKELAEAIVGIERYDTTGQYRELTSLISAQPELLKALKGQRLTTRHHPMFEPVGKFPTIDFNPIELDDSASTFVIARAFQISIFSTYDLKQLATLNTGFVSYIRYKPHGGFIATRSNDKHINIWNISDGKIILDIHAQGNRSSDFVWSSDGTLIADIDEHNSIRIWRTNDGTLQQTIDTNGDLPLIAFSPHDEAIVAADFDGNMALWMVNGGKLLWRTTIDKDILTIAWKSSEDTIAVGSIDSLTFINPVDGTIQESFTGLSSITQIMYDSEGSLLYTNNGVLFTEYNIYVDLFEDPGRYKSVFLSPNRMMLTFDADDNTMTFWKLASPPPLPLP